MIFYFQSSLQQSLDSETSELSQNYFEATLRQKIIKMEEQS